MITTLDKNTALVLIDLQKQIIQLPLAHPVDKVLENSAKLIAAFRKASLPVVIVNVILQAQLLPKPAGTVIQQEGPPQQPIFLISPPKLKLKKATSRSPKKHGMLFMKPVCMMSFKKEKLHRLYWPALLPV